VYEGHVRSNENEENSDFAAVVVLSQFLLSHCEFHDALLLVCNESTLIEL